MIDMLHYLDNPFGPSQSGNVLLGATRHEAGSWGGPDSLDYHRQRARLLHSLEAVDGVVVLESSPGLDDDSPQETGFVAIDLSIALINTAAAVAALVISWISARPLKDKDTVPGLRLEAPGATLVISHQAPPDQQLRLIEAFLSSAASPQSPGQGRDQRTNWPQE